MVRFKKIYLEITNSCNLNCNFCIKNSRPAKFLPKNEFVEILDKIKPYTNYLYFHILGEPLLHPNINEYIDYAGKNFYINITTNGYLINRIKTNNIRQLNISLHSFDLKYNIDLKTYMHNILKISKKLANNGTYISYRFWLDNEFTDEMLEMINTFFHTNINLKTKKKNITITKNIFISISQKFKWPDLTNDSINEKGSCYALKDHIGILVDGSVVPCCLDTKGDIVLGSIYDETLDEIMNKQRVQKMLKGFEEGKKYEELCRKCNFLN